MKRLGAAVLLAVAIVGGVAGQSPERVDAAAIARIRDEGLNRSQVMDTVFWLTDHYGPRLSGSPEFEKAGDWAMERLRAWGAANVRKERFRAGRGWSLGRFHATMIEPAVMPVIALPKAWSAGTSGTVAADVVRVAIASEAEAAPYRGKLRGKILLTQAVRQVRMLEHGDGGVLRYADRGGKWLSEALTPGGIGGSVRMLMPDSGAFDLMKFYRDEGVVALFDRGPDGDLAPGGSGLSWWQQRPDGGTIVLDEPFSGPPDVAGPPDITLAVEHYNRMARLLDRGIRVSVELNLAVTFTEETGENAFNIVAEIPGSDRADEIVLIGAHFDSWHAATGATDNAAGAAAMMEAVRIIKAAGLAPRRTIRLGLWGSEESGLWNGAATGLVGSQTYATEHLGTAAKPRPEHAKTSVYFNLDNGTGKIRGIWMQGNPAVKPIFEAWIAPLRDLGVDILSPRRVGQTDHLSFEEVGVPAFQFVQERYEYNARTHHTNMDVYDRIQPDDMRQMATVAAVFAWQAATRDQLLPRNSAEPSGAR